MKRSVAAPEKDGIFKSPLLAALRPFSVHTPAFFLLASISWSINCLKWRSWPAASSSASLSPKRSFSKVKAASSLLSSAAISTRPARTLCISAHSYSCSSPFSFISLNSLHSWSSCSTSTRSLRLRPRIKSCLAGFNLWPAAAASLAVAAVVAASVASAAALASSRSTMNPEMVLLLSVTLASSSSA